MRLVLLNVAVLFFAFANAAKYDINKDLENSNVVRKIDLSSQLVRIKTQITVKNNGASPVTSYLLPLEPQLASQLSHISALISKSKDSEDPLAVKEVKVDSHSSNIFYEIDLKNHAIASKSQINLVVETIFSHSLKPFPSHILQSEKQYVKYLGNLYLFSAYPTTSQETSIVCSSSNIDSYTKEKPFTIKDKNINYGPYQDIPAFKEKPLSLHYENNSPFLTVTHLTRVVEISHWGNIAVEETFDVFHSGAVLKGSFSRHDYQRSMDGVSSIKSFKTLLPLSARDIYYRDEIGNISTSSLKETDAGLELELRPRFPLFGGWKSHHYIGYNVPSYQYLYNKGDKFALVMKLIDHIYDDQIVDSFDLKIILPERSSDIELKAPYTVTRHGNEMHKTYLDTIGRPVVHVSKTNLVEQHIQDFQLHYTFSKQLMLQEPLMVFAAFFFLFLSAIIYVRLDFSISKDEVTEAKLRLSGLLRQVVELHERRSALYQAYDDAINKFKSNKDASALKSNQKNIDGDHKSLTSQITSFQSKLKNESQDASDKINELQRLDNLVRSQFTLLSQCSEKFVQGRLQKQQYVDSEASIRSSISDLSNNIDNIIATM